MMSRRGRDRSEATGCSFVLVDVTQDLLVAVAELVPDREVGPADLVELDQQSLTVLCGRHRVDLGLQGGLIVSPGHRDGGLGGSSILRTRGQGQCYTRPGECPS